MLFNRLGVDFPRRTSEKAAVRAMESGRREDVRPWKKTVEGFSRILRGGFALNYHLEDILRMPL